MPPRPLPTYTAAVAALGALFIQLPTIRWIVPLLEGDGSDATSDGMPVIVLYTILPTLMSIVWIWFFAVWREADGWQRLGLRLIAGNWLSRAVITGLATPLLGIFVVTVTAPIIGQPKAPPFPISIGDPRADTAYYIALFVAGACMAPVFEELVFRGITYNWLRHRLGVIASAVLVSVPHAAIHMDAATIPALSAIFVVYTYLYERTGTLWASITAHTVHNATILLFAFSMAGR